MERVVWSSSNNEVATVENGVVTGVKGGEVTITATLGELTASKMVYVVGDGLYSDQIGSRVGGYQYQDKPNYFNMAIGQSGEMIITATLSDSAAYYPMLMLRNMYSKAYYQKLIDYEKSFALLLYHESCIHCKNFVKSFNYSKSVIYKLEFDGLSERNVVTLYELFDEAFYNQVPTNDNSYSIAMPAVIRFEKGIISCISYGNIDTTNQYNYDLLASIIEGTFSGDTIIYQ